MKMKSLNVPVETIEQGDVIRRSGVVVTVDFLLPTAGGWLLTVVTEQGRNVTFPVPTGATITRLTSAR